jgi:hypothetical protein
MPRGRPLRVQIFSKLVPPRLIAKRSTPIIRNGPRLWNASQRIQVSKGIGWLATNRLFRSTRGAEWWKNDEESVRSYIEKSEILQQLSQDVKDFIVKGSVNLDRNQIAKLLAVPSVYFSRPHHVPLSERRQMSL